MLRWTAPLRRACRLRARKVEPLALADMKTFVARRPPCTPLSTAKLTRLTGLTPRTWQEAVEDYVPRTHWAPRFAGQ